ncbi:AraC family transcriptional regulator [Enterovibrio norvegicus]|uniref:DJ-1/PfpI family protein n=1 Tax=Enterovibrio norvegicus TaxID=188144 RepID=UPI0004744A7E|nr:DJ-1/PfpI family protein [Enterovibrio norvegicus]OEE61342.1 AraC family transcriptional regulator [Enterovibrio norvegicus]
MNIAILTFEGFNEMDAFVALSMLNRMKPFGWRVHLCSPSDPVTSMNGVTVRTQQPLEFANSADAVLVGSGKSSRDITSNGDVLRRMMFNPDKQCIGSQCSGALILSSLGLFQHSPACTDATTKPLLIASGATVLDQAFYAQGNLASAGGCLSSHYLAAWVIAKLAGLEHAKRVVDYVAPVGEKEETVDRCIKVIKPYL